MRELFVYYRVPPVVATSLLSAVRQMQQRLRDEEPALIARMLRQTGDDETETWMETYATLDGEGITTALQARIEARALVLLPLIDGPRHAEVFVACAS